MNFVKELEWRGMLHDISNETKQFLENNKVSGYIGFDPTSDSLHVGSLAQIMTLIHFQQTGNKPYILVGGATGMVGDPSGKSDERNLLSNEVLNYNLNGIQKQLEKFLNFNCGERSAVIVNNYDWFKDFTFLDFIRDVGKFITVNYMTAKESVRKRLDSENGMSFTEFSYQLVQGYDFYYLWKNHNCILQMGGSDQWGNIITGTDLIRKKGKGEAHALTTNLIIKADGTKFGKSEGGNIWLDPKKTKPFDFYKFWYNSSDEDAVNYIRIFTLLDQLDIEKLENNHFLNPNLRLLQNTLAEHVTTLVHGLEAYRLIAITNRFTYDDEYKWENLLHLTEKQFLEVFSSTNTFFTTKYSSSLLIYDDILTFLSEIMNYDDENNFKRMFNSKTDAKKLILNGGVYINKIKITLDNQITEFKFYLNKYLFIQRGKKNSALVILCNDVQFEMQRIQSLMADDNTW